MSRRGFLEQIRQGGVSLSRELAAAFAAVPREAFVPDGFQRRDGTWAEPADPDFLDLVYLDDVLVTKVDGRRPVSSSSQPSLMAMMIEALDVRPGHRVLEIGAGTGYNAALLASLGAEVVSIDVQPDVVARAREALKGFDAVRVEHGDGYAGVPGERFDRVIVTVGVAGLSPHWRADVVVAPVEHAGTHPVLRVSDNIGTVVTPSGFMIAAGPLTAVHPWPALAAPGTLTAFTEHTAARFDPPLEPLSYRDLWYAAGVWDRRTSVAALPRREQSSLILLDPSRTGGAAVLPDGSVLAGGAGAGAYAADAAALLDRWLAAGRPPMRAWRVGLAPAGDPEILVPSTWELSR
ncbi:methyltransferase domain-containing protein [Actinoplanes sp. NPDC049596]|uniref:protein-L-isoaspartate O-methyltransferase family protein n=1 Tax=unclassified Actinoplanes TaxID=2626549 RepID=UPI0034168D49